MSGIDRKQPPPSTAVLEDHVFARVRQQLQHPRELELLKWLTSHTASSLDLLQWLSGEEPWDVFIEEEPCDAILRSLPPLSCKDEPDVRAILTRRLGEAIAHLATNPASRQCRSSEFWRQLFALTERLNDPELLWEPIHLLLTVLEHKESTLLHKDVAILENLTELVANAQGDNRLEKRWITMVRKEKDTILTATPLTAFYGLMSMPDRVETEQFETWISFFCRSLDSTNFPDTEKTSITYRALTKINTEFHRFAQAIFPTLNTLWTTYAWFPNRHPLYFQQIDCSFAEYWIAAIRTGLREGNSNLLEGGLHVFLSMPERIPDVLIDDCTKQICQSIEQTKPTLEAKIEKATQLMQLIEAGHPSLSKRYSAAFAKLRPMHAWINQPDPVVGLLTQSDDTAVLAQLAGQFQNTSDGYVELAVSRYDSVCDRTKFGKKLKHDLKRMNENHSHGANMMEAGGPYSLSDYLKKKRQKLQTEPRRPAPALYTQLAENYGKQITTNRALAG